MTSPNFSLPSDLSKLTVPQLKALCKEKRITGYSKLGKAALLQRLAEFGAPPPQSHQQANPSANAAPLLLRVEQAQDPVVSPAPSGPSALPPQVPTTNVAQRTAQQVSSSTSESQAILAKTSPSRSFLSTRPSNSIQNLTIATSIQKPPAITHAKRPAHIEASAPQKRPRISVKPTAASQSHELPVPRTSTARVGSSVVSSVFRAPEAPPRPTATSSEKFSVQPSIKSSRQSAKAPPRLTGSGRFKPLGIARPKAVESEQTNRAVPQPPAQAAVTRSNDFASGFDLPAMPIPELSLIYYPPRASERKWVYRWAIILSALSSQDKQTCTLVSRMFRYAVYLSAAHILSRNFAGHRLDAMFQKYPKTMTNFWPYLRLRMAELSERRQRFKQSFFGRYTSSLGYDPLSEHLWTSPDDEKQVNIALRFVLTRMWFAISVGAYGHDSSSWTKSILKDVREIVKGEIWQVVAQCDGINEAFYVLEATCEVIGQPPSSEGKTTQDNPLRADWNAWILQRAQIDAGPRSLLDYVKWSNVEDYDRGISKAWLRRVSGQDVHSVAQRVVAERYILACVVANGISGQWMSTSAMAQDFAGLPEKGVLRPRTTAPSVNMYLPPHHHIESVHFKTSQGEAVHPAIAVIQTPSREYYILRENGMQVGCEEEGIPTIWQNILGCDATGRAV